MFSIWTLALWLVSVNAYVLGISLVALRALEAGRLKRRFLLLVLINLAWVNPLLLVRWSGLDETSAVWLSRSIFCSGVLLLASFGYFVNALFESGARSEDAKPRRRLLDLLFQANNAALLVLILLGYVENGVRQTTEGVAPIYGPLHPYFVGSVAAYGGYLFFSMWRRWQNAGDLILRAQIQAFLWTGLASFVLILATNALVPALTGFSPVSHAGALWTLLVFSGVLYILANGRRIFLRRAVQSLADREAFADAKNILALQELLHTVGRALDEQGAVRMLKRSRFRLADGATVDLFLHNDPERAEAAYRPAEPLLGWVEGFADNLRQLEADNKRLALANLRAEALLGAPLPLPDAEDAASTPASFGSGEAGKSEPGSASAALVSASSAQGRSADAGAAGGGREIDLEREREGRAENVAANRASFGLEWICVSPQLFAVLQQARRIARLRSAVWIQGESGAGRSDLARALHGLRGGGELQELSCRFASRDKLRERIQEFAERAQHLARRDLEAAGEAARRRRTGSRWLRGLPLFRRGRRERQRQAESAEPIGFLLRHVDAIAEEDPGLLEPLLRAGDAGACVYLTCGAGFLQSRPDLASSLERVSLEIPPLRERPEDLEAQALWMLDQEIARAQHPEDASFGFRRVAGEFLNQLKRRRWEGNSRELRAYLQQALAANRPPTLVRAPASALDAPESDGPTLTPLEESERRTIVSYLKKNNYNKTRTIQDLGITVNTLNAKIRRYAIPSPRQG